MQKKIIIASILNNTESIISILSRVTNAASFYMLTYLSSRYLTQEDFAKWSLYITFINLLPLFNLGISTGLVNRMSLNNSLIKKDIEQNSILINASFKFQFLISLIFILLILITTIFRKNFNNSLLIFLFDNKISIVFLFIGLPFQFYSSLLYSYRQINLSNYISILQNIILLIGSFVTYLFSKSLNIFILYYSITYTLLLSIFFVIALIRNNIRINMSFKDLKNISIITNSSFSFWMMSLFSNLLSTAQVFFVSFFFGLKSVPNFFLFQILFSIINTFHLAFLSPYTVKFISLATNNNWDKLKFLISNLSIKFTISLYLTLGLFIYLFHPIILQFWAHQTIKDYSAANIFFLIFFLSSIGNVYSVLLNSLGHFRIQIVFSAVSFLSFFIFLFVFKKYFGAVSVAMASIPSAFICLIFMIRYTNKIIIKNEILI